MSRRGRGSSTRIAVELTREGGYPRRRRDTHTHPGTIRSRPGRGKGGRRGGGGGEAMSRREVRRWRKRETTRKRVE